MNALLRQARSINRIIRNPRGVTLAELMIATAILSIGVLGLLGAFGGIQRSMQISKNKTLGANLAQEKMQILTQKNYYEVLVTPSPSFYAINGSTSVPYDPLYFPPETILEGGVSYTRLTYVQVAEEDSGAIVVLPPSTPDTGMHLITTTVVWNENGTNRVSSVSSVLANPNTVMSNSYFQGTVTDLATGNPIPGALVNIAENMGWRDTADGAGKYHINVNLGSYQMLATAQGYFPSFLLISIGQNASATQNFALQPMSSGTVQGVAWVNNHVIVSQVVQDTFTLCQDASGGISARDVEYVEIFNPTPSPVTLGSNTSNWYDPKNPSLWLSMEGGGGLSSTYGGEYNYAASYSLDLHYVNTVVPAQSYFLYANTPRFVLNGVWVTADAYFQAGTGMAPGGGAGPAAPEIPHFLSAIPSKAGYAGLVNYNPSGSPTWTPVDTVRWDSASSGVNGAPVWLAITSTASIPIGATTSLGNPKGAELVRISSPAASAADMVNFGHAYASGFNQLDFLSPGAGYTALPYLPHNVSSGAFTLVSGAPAVGAVVTASDPVSTSTRAWSVGVPPIAFFSLRVATATMTSPWTVLITSGIYTLENDSVTVVTSTNVYAFPSSTTILNQPAVNGFISGTVLDVFGTPITGPNIQINAGSGHATAATSNGRYLVATAAGTVDVVANPANGNSKYVAVSSLAVTAALGQVNDNINFVLSQGGRISGFVTRDGVNALPGVTVTAFDSNGVAQDSQVSDTSGRFTTVDIATGTYTVQPELDVLEVSSPTSTTAIIGSGQTVFSTTFTVTGAQGTISGTVKAGGSPITSGVLIIVTTSTLAGSPPAPPVLSSNTLSSSAIYLGSSLEDGTYSVSVRQSTSPTYNVYGYYTTLNSTGAVTFQSQELTGVSVVAGSSVTGQNFAW